MTELKNKKRYQIEKKFHDKWAESIKLKDVDYKQSFESKTAVENQHILSMLGSLKNKKILDLGCGMGDAALYFAAKGAQVHAADISPGMIDLVGRLSKKHGIESKITARVENAEKLSFGNDFFDIVYGNGLLHHVDPIRTFKEVRRVLKPKGKAAFIEPLAHNPIINIYRKVAREVRTETEKPLDFSILKDLSKCGFSQFHHQEFHLTTLLIFLWFFLIEKADPNKERYWKKIVNEGDKVAGVFTFLNTFDRLIVKHVFFL